MAISFMDIHAPDDVDQDTREDRRLLSGQRPNTSAKSGIATKDGHFVSAMLTAVPAS